MYLAPSPTSGWPRNLIFKRKGKCKHLLFSSSLGNTNTLTQMCSRVCIPLPRALVFNVYSCSDENSKISCHRWENLAQNSTFTVAWQIWMGLLASQNQRTLKSGHLNHPALESTGRKAGKESANGKPPETIKHKSSQTRVALGL